MLCSVKYNQTSRPIYELRPVSVSLTRNFSYFLWVWLLNGIWNARETKEYVRKRRQYADTMATQRQIIYCQNLRGGWPSGVMNLK